MHLFCCDKTNVPSATWNNKIYYTQIYFFCKQFKLLVAKAKWPWNGNKRRKKSLSGGGRSKKAKQNFTAVQLATLSLCFENACHFFVEAACTENLNGQKFLQVDVCV